MIRWWMATLRRAVDEGDGVCIIKRIRERRGANEPTVLNVYNINKHSSGL